MGKDELHKQLQEEAKNSGYYLNPDKDFTLGLLEGILKNKERYGYFACPCRLATGGKEDDLDIICPCDYRDADLVDFDACYCGLYVSGEVISGKIKLQSIPERRTKKEVQKSIEVKTEEGKIYVWRCKVCGYLCAREKPPEKCPICKVGKERFEIFTIVV